MAGASIPAISDDLPEPETPVIVVKHPSGILTFIEDLVKGKKKGLTKKQKAQMTQK
jgi:hypothetical protein